MRSTRKSFSRIPSEKRKQDLIEAALRLIASSGISSATVRAIAKEADVTQGLIRHYFSTKEELIAEAFKHHMATVVGHALEAATSKRLAPPEKLSSFIHATMTPPALTPKTLSIWAAFMQTVRIEPFLMEVHKREYLDYRHTLKALITDVFDELGRNSNDAEARALSITCNAVLDGLWIEGGMLPDCFNEGEVIDLAYSSVEALLKIDPLPRI